MSPKGNYSSVLTFSSSKETTLLFMEEAFFEGLGVEWKGKDAGETVGLLGREPESEW